MIKRILDVLFAVPLLVLALPVLLVISALIKLETPGPVFYRQAMVGRSGKVFALLRFRTMRGSSNDRASENGFTFVGRFIRNYSLDHLPQLLNLLIGDLTLVGPRPMERHVIDFQDLVWMRYLQVKPGLINYAVYKLGKHWTPSRSSAPRLNQQLELEYMQKRSAMSDLQLVLRSLRN